MKKFYFKSFITALLLLCSTVASAHDFEVDGIYYNIANSSAKTVAVTYKGEYYYQYTSYNGAITIPSAVTYNGTTHSVTSIGNYAFASCYGLTSITIPNSVTSIGDRAFQGCDGLTSVTIPNSVTSIGDLAFYYCPLEKVEINTRTIDSWFGGHTSIKEIIIGNSVTSIGGGAFYGCSGLTSVTIGNSVTSIGDEAFRGCSGLTSVTIPNSVTSIGYWAFQGCSGLTSVTIGNSVTSIGNWAFWNCRGLTSITIPNSVTSIGDEAFYNCYIKKVIWLTNTPPTGYSNISAEVHYVSNDLYTKLNKVKVYPYLSYIFTVDGVKYVPVNPSQRTCDAIDCLHDNSAEKIIVGKTVKYKNIEMTVNKLMPYAFYGNKYIKNATISNNGDIGTYAFSDCTSLENATISNNGDIGDSAFRECTSLAIVSINNKDSIGDYAFYGCSSLKEVVLSDSVTSLGNYSFQSCSALESVVIGNGITSIGSYAFSGCCALPEITIPQSTTTISNYAFEGCSSLADIIFGRNMKTIGEEAFSDCNNLTTIISLATTPPVCGSQALVDINKWECVLYVPGNYISTYQTAEQWKDFFFIENAPISFTADVDGDGSIDVADVTEVVDAILNGEGENENTPFEIIFDAWTSTNTANSSTSQKSYTLEVTEGSVLTFDWKVSSENNCDWLIITLDGTQILKKSGSYSGSYEHTFTTAGTHTLVVEYTKDSSSSSGSDQGKIHNIKLTGTANDTTDVNADVDGDGSIDIADVTALVEIILGTKQ